MSNPDVERLIAAWLDGRINQAESELLQQELKESADARTAFRMYTKLDAAIRGLAVGDVEPEIPSPVTPQISGAASPWKLGMAMWVQLAMAAALLMLVGGIAYQFGKSDNAVVASNSTGGEDHDEADQVPMYLKAEKTISGHATLRRVAGIQWSDGKKGFRQGDVLPGGLLEFDEGVAEIDFFCGATVVVEGPAKIDLESDWSARLIAGRLRANVPPAARGFVIKAADSEIVDLGTEFALEVGPENVQVAVVDGEIRLQGGEHDGQHLVTGQSQSLVGNDAGEVSFADLFTTSDVQRQNEFEQKERFEQWKEYSQKFRKDKRLIAYYPIAELGNERFVKNASAMGQELDGKIVGPVDHTNGRFGFESASLGFGRPGSRVRSLIDGEFAAFTFSCWVRVDSLDHLYNALFMGDGYENGEPHWQIREDGRLMFSVMIDDTPGSGEGKIPGARLNWVYHSEPVWDVSMSGQWMHVAAVYDPANWQVRQYVNGIEVSNEEITDKYFTNKLRIGPAEIGNWGQPFRSTPGFAVRNLNGAIDELAIFKAALSADEIKTQFEQGKPFGY